MPSCTAGASTRCPTGPCSSGTTGTSRSSITPRAATSSERSSPRRTTAPPPASTSRPTASRSIRGTAISTSATSTRTRRSTSILRAAHYLGVRRQRHGSEPLPVPVVRVRQQHRPCLRQRPVGPHGRRRVAERHRAVPVRGQGHGHGPVPPTARPGHRRSGPALRRRQLQRSRAGLRHHTPRRLPVHVRVTRHRSDSSAPARSPRTRHRRCERLGLRRGRLDGLGEQVRPNGTPLLRFGGFGSGPGKFPGGGRDVTVDGNGNVWVGDMPGFRAQVFSPQGDFLFQVPSAPSARPRAGSTSRAASPWTRRGTSTSPTPTTGGSRSSRQRHVPHRVGPSGRRQYGFNYQRGIDVDLRDDSVVVADTDNHMIKKYTRPGRSCGSEAGSARLRQFKNPHGLDRRARRPHLGRRHPEPPGRGADPDGTPRSPSARRATPTVSSSSTGTSRSIPTVRSG